MRSNRIRWYESSADISAFQEILEIKNKKILQEDDVVKVYEETVKPIGNGAMIMSAKRFIGKKSYVVVKK